MLLFSLISYLISHNTLKKNTYFVYILTLLKFKFILK